MGRSEREGQGGEAPRATFSARGECTRDRLKRTAEALFAERGVDGVGVREILDAAGLRNIASLNHYFGGKDELVRELIVDGARNADSWRLARLAEVEQQERITVRDVVRVLCWPVLSTDPLLVATDTHIRFISNIQNVDRAAYHDALSGRWNVGYQRCLELLRGLIALPNATLNERFIFFDVYSRGVLAAREAEIARAPQTSIWVQARIIENFFDTVEALLTTPVSVRGGEVEAARTEADPA